MRLRLKLDVADFAQQLAQELRSGGVVVVDAVEELLRRSLEDSVHAGLGAVLVKAARAVVSPSSNRNRFLTVGNLAQSGFVTWYPEVRFATPLDFGLVVEGVDVEGFALGSIRYGGGLELDHRYTHKRLKTQENHTIRLNEVKLPAAAFEEVAKLLEGGPPTQPLIANLTTGPGVTGFRIVTFDHITDGSRVLCSCHAAAHRQMREEASKLVSSYGPGSWPHLVLDLLDLPSVDGICHLCVAARHGPDVLADWFGRQVETNKEPYIDALVGGERLDERTARAEVDRRLGLSRWTREAELHRQILALFPAKRVRREASPSWLGRQRLDIYLPDLRLALEHQGEQHYRPIPHFGGEEAHERTIERDNRKRALCAAHGVDLVYVRYDESLSRAHLRTRLRRWLEA